MSELTVWCLLHTQHDFRTNGLMPFTYPAWLFIKCLKNHGMVNNELCLHKSWGDKKGECNHKAKKKYMCVYCHMSKKSRVGRSALIFFFLLSAKPEIVVPCSGIRYFIFEISGKPSFVLWRVTQFFYLLCSEFRQKASGWINKTLLLIKQQKWLSEFCVKIDRVVSKN